jgi:hypothetical protein
MTVDPVKTNKPTNNGVRRSGHLSEAMLALLKHDKRAEQNTC